MSTLDTLKQKWFINILPDDQFPPKSRFPGSQIQPFTDGNLIEPLIDGLPLMADFLEQVTAILNSPDPTQYEIWLTQWRLDPVKLLGVTNPAPDAHTLLFNAAEAGVKVYFLGSGHVGRRLATTQFAKKLNAKGGHAACDLRFPLFGSQHQKFIIIHGPKNQWSAYAGSADLNFARWDTPAHLDTNPDLPKNGQGTSHDVSVRARGPVVHDLALSFAERWNDPNRKRTVPQIKGDIATAFVNTPISVQGPHSVQILRTYGINPKRGYAWANIGEFTIWAAYLNAIKQARQYIYLEDQYFYSFGDPPAFELKPGKQRNSDIVVQLGEAIKRGVHVLALVPSRRGNSAALYQTHYRRRAAQYLHNISASSPDAGQFAICSLSIGQFDPVVHSKLLLADDEFTLLGSANICRRSMAHDTEIHLGIVDGENRFTRDLRLALWQEHIELDSPETILDPVSGMKAFAENAAAAKGRLRLYSVDPGQEIPLHNIAMNTFTDPYKGPPP